MTGLPETIATRRLILRQPLDRDIPEIVRQIGNWNVSKWLGVVPHPYVALHARQWLVRNRALRAQGRDLTFSVALFSRPDRVIGAVGCHFIDAPSPGIGYWLAERHWGKGYMSEAVAAVLAELFRLKPTAIPVSAADSRNARSLNVLEKAGFRRQRRPAWHMCRSRGHKVKVILLRYGRA